MEQIVIRFVFLFCIGLIIQRQHNLKKLRRVNRLRGLVISSHCAAPEWKTPALLLAVIFSGMSIGRSWLGESPVALAQKAVEPSIQVHPTSLSTKLPSFPTRTQTPTTLPSPTLSPTPTPLPIPTTGVIWNRENGWVYFWESPGQGILEQIPNGMVVTFLDEWEPYGGKAWARVEWDGQAGWVDASIVWRVTMPENFPVVTEGTYLYAEPAGKQLEWLPAGTPLRPGVGWIPPATPTVQKFVGEGGHQWVQVTLLDGTEGWVSVEFFPK